MKQHELPFLAGSSDQEPIPVSRGEQPMNDSRLLEYLQVTLSTLKSGRPHLAKRSLEALIKEMLETQRAAA